MAVKTITIDIDAYEILARHKAAGQSFSRLIKQHFRRRATARDLLAAVRNSPLSPKALEGVEREISARRLSRPKAAKL